MKIRHMISKIEYTHILAVIFLAAIFYISTATLPSAMNEISALLGTKRTGIAASAKKIDDMYVNMLSFRGDPAVNKAAYIDFNGLMSRLIGQRFMNDRVRLDNGHLSFLSAKQTISTPAEQMTKLFTRQEERGKSFLFVLTPFQLPLDEDILPAGYIDYGHMNSDALLSLLRENGVPVLDLREEMSNDGISYNDAFYVTDHHWKPETGFWAYAKIIDCLTKSGDMEPVDKEYTDIDMYEMEVYKNLHLGSAGKRTGIYYAGVEDFGILAPKDPEWGKDISFEVPTSHISVEGSFKDILYNYARLDTSHDYYNTELYAGFGYANRGVKHYHNESAPTNLRIMAIGDSYAFTTYPFLSLIAESFDYLEMPLFQGSFEEYYDDFDPDIVIVMVFAQALNVGNTTYDFFGDQ